MGLLTVVASGGVLVGRPFTEYYARQDVPREPENYTKDTDTDAPTHERTPS